MTQQTIDLFTVVLRYPDYMQDDGRDDYFFHPTHATGAVDAADKARAEATRVNRLDGNEINDPDDFAVVAVFRGNCEVAMYGWNL